MGTFQCTMNGEKDLPVDWQMQISRQKIIYARSSKLIWEADNKYSYVVVVKNCQAIVFWQLLAATSSRLCHRVCHRLCNADEYTNKLLTWRASEC
jgi:hypothetical protein